MHLPHQTSKSRQNQISRFGEKSNLKNHVTLNLQNFQRKHRPANQGCQMVRFHTKNPNFGKILSALEWKMLLYF
jgi:hypothetical protein